jgi:altronate dehydratase
MAEQRRRLTGYRRPNGTVGIRNKVVIVPRRRPLQRGL